MPSPLTDPVSFLLRLVGSSFLCFRTPGRLVFDLHCTSISSATMPPRVLKKTAVTTPLKKTGAKAPSKSSKIPAKPVSSSPSKAEPEAVENVESEPSLTVEAPKAEERVVEPFQDLNEPSVEAEPEKDIPIEDANKEDKEPTKDADKPSAEGSEEGVKGIELEKKMELENTIEIEKKETDVVMHEALDNEVKDEEHQDEPVENNVVIGEQSHGVEAGDGAGCREDGVGVDGGDVEMPAMVKERIKQKEFEVFVGGLDKDADEEDLKKVFSGVGEVVEIRLAKNPLTQKNKGFGFVRFATVEQAKKAVVELKNPQVRGKQCGVTRSQDNETLHVRNICKSWTKETLEKKLTEYGIDNIEEITLMEDPQQEGANRGFAFLEFPTHLEATNAFKRLQKRDVFFGIDLCAKVAFAKSGIEPDEEVMAQVKSIFVDGLPPAWDEERVQDKFKKYGEIEKIQLARNMPTAKRKDFGFISFTTREAALACIEGVNKNELNEEDNKVTLKATLRKPQQKGRSVKDGVRAGYGGFRGGRVPWVRGIGDIEPRRTGARDSRFGVHEGRRYFDERRQPFGRAYDRRPPGPAYVRSDSRRNYREDDAYPDRRGRPSGRSAGTVARRSSYRDDYGYHEAGYTESMPPRRPAYPEDSYSHRMNGMSAYNDGPVRDYAGVSGSKRPYSDDDDLPYTGRHSRSRLDYDVGAVDSRYGAVDSRYGGVSRLGQDQQSGYGAGGRSGGIYSNDYLPSGNDVEGGQYPPVISRNATGGYGRGSGSASYY